MKIEGIPTPENNPHVAYRALEKIGRVLKFDAESCKEGPKAFLRAKIIAPTERALVPGYYYEFSPGNIKWIHIRYESIFNFCHNCGKIGHRRPLCRVPVESAKNEINHRLRRACGANFDFMQSRPAPPLYSKRLMGLEDIERFRTSRIDLRRIPNAGNGSDSPHSSDSESSNSSNPPPPPEIRSHHTPPNQPSKPPEHGSRSNSGSKRKGPEHNHCDQPNSKKVCLFQPEHSIPAMGTIRSRRGLSVLNHIKIPTKPTELWLSQSEVNSPAIHRSSVYEKPARSLLAPSTPGQRSTPGKVLPPHWINYSQPPNSKLSRKLPREPKCACSSINCICKLEQSIRLTVDPFADLSFMHASEYFPCVMHIFSINWKTTHPLINVLTPTTFPP